MSVKTAPLFKDVMNQQMLHEMFERKAWRTVACKVCAKKTKTQELEVVCTGCLSNWKSCLTCGHAAAMSDPECEFCCGTGRYEGILCQACPEGDCFHCTAMQLIKRIVEARENERCN